MFCCICEILTIIIKNPNITTFSSKKLYSERHTSQKERKRRLLGERREREKQGSVTIESKIDQHDQSMFMHV